LYFEELFNLCPSPNIAGDEIKNDKNSRACDRHARLEGLGGILTGFWWKRLNELEHLGDLGVDGPVLEMILRTRW
jgi:hypothetical protein